MNCSTLVDPVPLPGWPINSIEPFSVALDTANNLYVGSSRAFGQSLNEVHKFSPYPNFNAVAKFGFSFCSSGCVATPFISIPYSNEIYVTSARYTELIPPTVLAPTFIAAFGR